MRTRKPAPTSRALLMQIHTARAQLRTTAKPESKPQDGTQDGSAIETNPTSSSRRPPWAESHAQALASGQDCASVALHLIKRGKSPRERRTSQQIALSRAVLRCVVPYGTAALVATEAEPATESQAAGGDAPTATHSTDKARRRNAKTESIRRQLRAAFTTSALLSLCPALLCFACGATHASNGVRHAGKPFFFCTATSVGHPPTTLALSTGSLAIKAARIGSAAGSFHRLCRLPRLAEARSEMTQPPSLASALQYSRLRCVAPPSWLPRFNGETLAAAATQNATHASGTRQASPGPATRVVVHLVPAALSPEWMPACWCQPLCTASPPGPFSFATAEPRLAMATPTDAMPTEDRLGHCLTVPLMMHRYGMEEGGRAAEASGV
ncbi:uncharacterized protein PAN0_016c5256 [Moesziomyces antarcticus]|uniref:Uncharacterized protein n=1 Tax=Pseudozyma antarctica TaxID=84753 RepID=A0A081CK34_PSEA2|nr:uncharacterized protein PAN0_016c5256 [Moesziomyces antarcticus]GAK67030.1 hypothetical protein PAN0_016c5256 [Moesziomyces antarcticus]